MDHMGQSNIKNFQHQIKSCVDFFFFFLGCFSCRVLPYFDIYITPLKFDEKVKNAKNLSETLKFSKEIPDIIKLKCKILSAWRWWFMFGLLPDVRFCVCEKIPKIPKGNPEF